MTKTINKTDQIVRDLIEANIALLRHFEAFEADDYTWGDMDHMHVRYLMWEDTCKSLWDLHDLHEAYMPDDVRAIVLAFPADIKAILDKWDADSRAEEEAIAAA